MTSDGPRTVVLGFDALSFEYLDEFADELPNFGRLRSTGIDAPLRSTHPPWTGSAWPSMYTGTDPSRHDAYGFFDYEDTYPDEANIITRNDVQQPAIWNYLTSIDEPSIVLNVPVTHPAEPLNGVLVPGYLASEDADGYPKDIRGELSDALGEEYTIYSQAEMVSDKERKLDGYADLVGMRARAAEYLLTNYEWRVAIIQVQKTDAVFHNFDERSAFRRIYRAADDLVGTVQQCAADANIVVCSDHGMGVTNGYKLFVNEILREHGFVREDSTGNNYGTSLSSVKQSIVNPDEQATTDTETSPIERAASMGITGLGKVGLTPAKVLTVAQRVGLEEELKRLVPSNVRSAAERTVDWRRSKAYCRALGELGIRINLEGRDPNGVVPPSEYESVRSELIEILSSVRTPDGRLAFDFVDRAENVNHDPDPGSGPDVVFMPKGMNHLVLPGLVGERFLPVDEYNHKPDGVFIGTGPAFDPSVDPERLSLTDVAPIVMASAGLDVPDRMTGHVPQGMVTLPVERSSYRDIEYGSTEAVETEGDVTSRLEDLGYL